jgi:hypothetical protein
MELIEMPAIIRIEGNNEYFECEVSDTVKVEQLSNALIEKGHTITHLISKKRSLEKEFLQIIK